MKKIFVLLLLVLLLIACDKEKAKPMPEEFDADITVSVGEKEYMAIYEKRLGSDKLMFLAPDTIKGLEFTLCGGTLLATMGDKTFECENLKAIFDFLPVTAFGTKTVGERVYRINERSIK